MVIPHNINSKNHHMLQDLKQKRLLVCRNKQLTGTKQLIGNMQDNSDISDTLKQHFFHLLSKFNIKRIIKSIEEVQDES